MPSGFKQTCGIGWRSEKSQIQSIGVGTAAEGEPSCNLARLIARMLVAAANVCADPAPGQDPSAPVRPPRGGGAGAGRAWQAGDVRLPGLHPYLRPVSARPVSAVSANPRGPQTGQGKGSQGGASAADARSDP